MKPTFRAICLWLMLLLLLMLAGCGVRQTEEKEGEKEGGDSSVTEPAVSLVALPYYQDQSLDPLLSYDGIQQDLGALLYEGLFRLDENATPQRLLCSSYSCSQDAMTYVFRLRQDVYFSDQSPLTAADVVSGLKRAKNSQRYSQRLQYMRSVKATGDYEVTVQLSRPNSSFPALLDIPIVKTGTENSLVPTGTGPYRLVTEEKHASLQANPYWWKGSPTLSTLPLVNAKDSDTLLNLLNSHNIQLLSCDMTQLKNRQLSGGFDSYEVDSTQLLYLGFNTRGIFSDAKLRSVVEKGIDRSQIVTAFLSGHAKAAQFPVSPLSPLYPAYLETDFSPAAYGSALEELGFGSGKQRTVTLLVNEENSFRVSVAHYIAQSLTAGSLSVSVRTLPWEEYTAALQRGDFDLYLGETRQGADWDFGALTERGGSLNYGLFQDALLEQLLTQYLSTPENQRAEAMNTLCSYLQEAVPFVSICFTSRTLLVQQGVTDSPSAGVNSPYATLAEWSFLLEGDAAD